ncbi:hypothetical protein H8959_001395, partial [Pygathrix nigripes]
PAEPAARAAQTGPATLPGCQPGRAAAAAAGRVRPRPAPLGLAKPGLHPWAGEKPTTAGVLSLRLNIYSCFRGAGSRPRGETSHGPPTASAFGDLTLGQRHLQLPPGQRS